MGDKANPLLSSASQLCKLLDLEMKPEMVNCRREIKRQLTVALSVPGGREKEGLRLKKGIILWSLVAERGRNRRLKWEREWEGASCLPLLLHKGCLVITPPPQGTLMKLSILPLNSLWLYMERGLGFRNFCGLGGRVGGLGNDGEREQKHHIL